MNFDFLMIGGGPVSTIILWLLIIGGAALLLVYRERIASFTREVKVELLKASWPWEPKERGMKKYKELIDSTVIVLIAMMLLAGYVGTWDFIMLKITQAITYLAR